MSETCLFCKVREVCRYYINIGKRVYDLGLPHNLSKDIHAFLRVNLPKHCGHYDEMPKLENDRDSLGRLIDRKPLKLWYPNQVDEGCRHCGHKKSDHSQGIWCNTSRQTMYQKEAEVREKCECNHCYNSDFHLCSRNYYAATWKRSNV